MKIAIAWMALALPLAAASSEPGGAAVGFLEKLRTEGGPDLAAGGDTAISENTQKSKRERIADALSRLAETLKTGKLESVATKTDGDFAAVIVCQSDGMDAWKLHAHPIGLIRRGGVWRAAPVIGSFENTGIGLDPATRARARALENWMLDEQSRQIVAVRDEINGRLQREIAASVPAAQLATLTAGQAVRSFLDACAAGKAPLALALLGGLQPGLTEDWPLRLKAVHAAFDHPAGANPVWRLLTAPEVFRTVVEEEADRSEGEFRLACIDPLTKDPSGIPVVQVVYFELAKEGDSPWQVNPPAVFFRPSGAAAANRENDGDGGEFVEGIDTGDDVDDELLDALPERARETYPAREVSEFGDVVKDLSKALAAPTPGPLIRLLDFSGPAETAVSGIRKAVALWYSLHDPARLRVAVMLDSHADGDTAAASIQVASPGDDDLNLRLCYFERTGGRWHLLSGLAPDDTCAKRYAGTLAWADRERARWEGAWQAKLLENCPVVEPSEATPPPADDAVRALLGAWRKAIASRDFGTAIGLTARLKGAKSATRLLRNVGYELASPPLAEKKEPPVLFATGKAWAAGTCTPPTGSGVAVYPIVNTPAGARILMEADLFLSANSGRSYLDRQTWSHLRGLLPANVVDDLHGLSDRLGAEKKPANAP